MTLPTTIRVGAAVYTVRRRKLEEKYDLTDHIKARIDLHVKQAPTQERDTVLHEVLHVACTQAALANHPWWSHEVEETLAGTLAPWLLCVIRDNPDLIEYLQEA